MKLQKGVGWGIPIILVAFVVLLTPQHSAHAWCATASGCAEEFLALILNLFGLILGFAGVFLNLVIQYTIVEMRDFITGITGINIAWTVLRDLANILFVFILLFIGINTILGSWNQSSFSTKLIPKVILAALLINFSLFFTKVIIDVSNIVTYEFYKATSSLGEPTTVEGVTVNMGLAGAFMDGLKVTAIGDIDSTLPNYAIFRTFLSIIFYLVAAFVFFTIGFMLIVRFVVLIFLMLTSPIAFLGGLLPQLKPHAEDWWKQLSAQATFAPIFMMLALVVILIVRDPGFGTLISVTNPTSPAEIAQKTMGDLVKIILQYCIAMFLLITALVTAKKTAGKVGSGFTSWGEKLAKTATYGAAFGIGRLTKSAAGTVARGTVGKGAEVIGKRYDSFLAKNIPTYNKINKITGGMAGALDRGVRKKIEGVEKSKFGTTQSRGEVLAAERARAKKFSEVLQKDEAQAKIDNNAAHVQDVLKKGIAGSFDSEADKAIKDYLEGVSDLANDKVIEMFENDFDKLTKDKHLMAAITPKQLAAITDSKNDKLTSAEKKTFKDEHKAAVQQRIALAPDNYAEARKVASGKHVDVANMHKDLLTNHYVAAALSPNALKEILENDKLDPTERATVKKHIEDRVNDLNRKVAVGATLTPGETKEIASLQKTIDWLYNPDIVKKW